MSQEVGDVFVRQKEETFEWRINNFFELEDRAGAYRSPKFYFNYASWEIHVYPFGLTRNKSRGYVGLNLCQMSLPKYSTVKMTLGFKTVNEKSDLEVTHTEFIDEIGAGFYRPRVISRSDLVKRRIELLPCGTLTVICTLKNFELNTVIDPEFMKVFAKAEERTERQFLDASVQTGEVTESKVLDASAQTKEGTGIWTLQKHLQEISLNGDVSDIILKVEDQEFKLHRCILAARSPVFSAMMQNEMKENVTGVVDIEDIDPETFSDFLNYLYTGSTEDLMPENVAKLYTVADKYQMEELKENCLNYMLVNVSIENFCDVFIISVQHNEEKLKEICFKFFGKHLLDIIQTCKWQTFACENPIVANELHIKHIQLNKDFYTMLSKK